MSKRNLAVFGFFGGFKRELNSHFKGKEQIMNRYLVVWLREGRENVDVIDNAITPHEAANKVREVHVNANVVAVGIMLDNEQWNYL